MVLTKRTMAGEGSRAGATQSEAKRTPSPSPKPQRKVIDRDALVEVLSQLRDDVEEALERVNDLVYVIPQEQFEDGTPIPTSNEYP